MKKILKIVFVIIASFVGAGFASGKEIYEFFYIYGRYGIIGIFISSTIIVFTIYKVLNICQKNKIKKYSEFCEYIVNSNKFLSSILNKIINIFLLITFLIMISGFSSLLKQEYNINKYCGALVIVVLSYIILIKNLNGLIKISNFLVPVFIIFLGIVMIKDANYLNVLKNSNISKIVENTIINNWLLKSILYSSYNCAVLIPVIVIISKNTSTKNECIYTSILVFILLIVLSISIFSILIMGNLKIYSLEMPIIAIMQKYGNLYRMIYISLVSISIFTTAISSGLSFLNNVSKNKKAYIKNLTIICFISIPISQISFGVMVQILYPALGLIGVMELTCIIKSKSKTLKQK